MIKYLLAISLILHLGILSIKITKPKKKSKKKSEQVVKVKLKQPDKKGAGSKDEDIFMVQEVVKMLEQMQKIAEEDIAVKSMLKKCDTFYMGIGVVHSSLFGSITLVAPGGPADQAGVLVGDTPLDSLDIRDKYPEGTLITVSVLRNGIIHNVPVTIGKICTDEKKP